jgi:hypothetical protein
MRRLCLYFLDCFDVFEDVRFLNIALRLVDQRWLGFRRKAEVGFAVDRDIGGNERFWQTLAPVVARAALAVVASPSWRHALQTGSSVQPIRGELELAMTNLFASSPPNVAVLSPNKYGLQTLLTLELLKRHGIRVDAVVVRRLVSPSRLLQEIRSDPMSLAWKIRNKLILRGEPKRAEARFISTAEYLRRLGCESRTVDAWCRENGAEVIYASSLGTPEVLEILRRVGPKIVVFTGGGIVRKPVLDLSGAGVLNCHSSLLPQYRGIDVIEWAALNRNPETFGLTTHFMVSRVDQGDVLGMRSFSPLPGETILDNRSRLEPLMAELLVHCAIGYLTKEIRPVPQNLNDGVQYFAMHNSLRRIAEKRFEEYACQPRRHTGEGG